MVKNFEYIEIYYLNQNDIISLRKGGVLYTVVSKTECSLVLSNILKQKWRIILKTDYPKVYRQNKILPIQNK